MPLSASISSGFPEQRQTQIIYLQLLPGPCVQRLPNWAGQNDWGSRGLWWVAVRLLRGALLSWFIHALVLWASQVLWGTADPESHLTFRGWHRWCPVTANRYWLAAGMTSPTFNHSRPDLGNICAPRGSGCWSHSPACSWIAPTPCVQAQAPPWPFCTQHCPRAAKCGQEQAAMLGADRITRTSAQKARATRPAVSERGEAVVEWTGAPMTFQGGHLSHLCSCLALANRRCSRARNQVD